METEVQEKINKVMDVLGEHQEMLEKLASKEKLGISMDISIDIVDGKGVYEQSWIPTFGGKVGGSATLLEPANGTWTVDAYDEVGKKHIFQGSGIKVDQEITFEYKTNFSGSLQR